MRLKQRKQALAHLVRYGRHAQEPAALARVLGCGGDACSNRPRRCAPDVLESVLGRELGHGKRIHDSARDASFHDDIAEALLSTELLLRIRWGNARSVVSH